MVKLRLALKLIDFSHNQVIKLLGLSKSCFYLKLKQPLKDEELKEKIINVLNQHPSYGHRRIALALGLGKKRVRRAMRLFKIKPFKRKARWTKRRDFRRPEAVFTSKIKSSKKKGGVFI